MRIEDLKFLLLWLKLRLTRCRSEPRGYDQLDYEDVRLWMAGAAEPQFCIKRQSKLFVQLPSPNILYNHMQNRKNFNIHIFVKIFWDVWSCFDIR